MLGQGSFVNGLSILCGAIAGAALGGRFDARFRTTALNGIALVVVLIGLKMALTVDNVLVMIGALLIGAIIGELIGIEATLERVALRIQKIFRAKESRFAQGFVAATLLFCVGSMAILGSIEEGVRQDSSILFAKSLIDGATAVTFAATLGLGVALSALPVMIYQGSITIASSYVAPYLTTPVVTELSATGGLLIAAIGLNMLEVTKIRVGNLLPAIFLAGLARVFM